MAEFRRARVEDLSALSELCFRSKAHWGYDDAFMEACRDQLTLRTSDLENGEVWMLEGPLATFQLVRDGDIAALETFFVDPSVIGQGLGRRCYMFGLYRARNLKCTKLAILSDPNAAPFYHAMGAKCIGSEPSGSLPGRFLPAFEVDLTQPATTG